VAYLYEKLHDPRPICRETAHPTQFATDHFFYVSRLIAALLVATLVPLVIDRRFRR
jgi:hypothetical protein